MSILIDAKKQAEDFKKLTSDANRWAWIIEINKDQIKECKEQTIYLILDNDQTLVKFRGVDDYGRFDEYISQSMGTVELLNVLRINCEYA